MDIKGYRELSADEVATVNMVRDAADEVGQLVDELARGTHVDPRWLAIGRTQLQQGFMALVRAVARPTTF